MYRCKMHDSRQGYIRLKSIKESKDEKDKSSMYDGTEDRRPQYDACIDQKRDGRGAFQFFTWFL